MNPPAPAPASTPVQRRRRWWLLLSCIALVFAVSAAVWSVALPGLSAHGISVVVRFPEGHGLKPGDALQLRGIRIGEVRSVELSGDIRSVEATIDLEKSANQIAVEGSQFWIARPRVGLSGVSGLGTIAGANYVGVEPGKGGRRTAFDGLVDPPISEITDPDSLRLTLLTTRLGGLSVGSPVTHRQIRVGSVESIRPRPDSIEVGILIESRSKDLVRANSAFWNAGGFTLQADLASGLQIQAASLESILSGGVAFQTLGESGPAADPATPFRLEDGPPPTDRGQRIAVVLRDGRGLKPGDPLMHLGVRLGKVASVELFALKSVLVEVDLNPRADALAVEGSQFWVVRPQIDMAGVEGIETAITGKYLAAVPGPPGGKPTTRFTGLEEPPLADLSEQKPGGLRIVLKSPNKSSLRKGTPLSYRQIHIGTVESAELASDASCVEVRVYVMPEFRELIRTNSLFWNPSGLKVGYGVLSGLRIDSESAQTVLMGGLSMALQDSSGSPVANGHRFTILSEAPDPKELAKWTPSIAFNRREGDKLALPQPVQGVLRYQVPGRVVGTKDAEARGELLLVRGASVWVYGPSEVLRRPAKAKPDKPARLELAGVSLDVADAADGSRVSWKALTPAELESLKDLLPKAVALTHFRVPGGVEDCQILGDAANPPLFVSATRWTAAEGGWRLDASLVENQLSAWHGAVVVGGTDNRVLGWLDARDKKNVRLIPVTDAMLK